MCPHLTFTQNLGSSPPVRASLCFMSVSSLLPVPRIYYQELLFLLALIQQGSEAVCMNTLEGYLRVQCSMHAFSPMPQADSLAKPVSHPITTVHDLQHNSTELPVCLTESETRTLHFQNCRSTRDSRMRRTVCRSYYLPQSKCCVIDADVYASPMHRYPLSPPKHSWPQLIVCKIRNFATICVL